MIHGYPGLADFRVAILGGMVAAGVSMLSGCNWSPPTLAVELPGSAPAGTARTAAAVVTPVPSEDATPDPVEAIPGATVDDMPPQPTEAVTVAHETSDDGQSRPTFSPKLTNVSASQLIGRWRDSFFGTRTLTLKADGTATMVLDLDFAGRLLYGKRLEFDMKWSLKNGVVTIDILEGRPAAASKSATGAWGSRYQYLLDRVDAEAVEMRSSDGAMNHTLKRLADDE